MKKRILTALLAVLGVSVQMSAATNSLPTAEEITASVQEVVNNKDAVQSAVVEAYSPVINLVEDTEAKPVYVQVGNASALLLYSVDDSGQEKLAPVSTALATVTSAVSKQLDDLNSQLTDLNESSDDDEKSQLAQDALANVAAIQESVSNALTDVGDDIMSILPGETPESVSNGTGTSSSSSLLGTEGTGSSSATGTNGTGTGTGSAAGF